MMKGLFQIALGILGVLLFAWLTLKIGVFLVFKFDLVGDGRWRFRRYFTGTLKIRTKSRTSLIANC